jgi:ribonuclease J
MTEEVKSGEIFITAGGQSDVSRRIINERLALAEDGVLFFSVVLTENGDEIVSGPELQSKGFIQPKEEPELFKDIEESIADSIMRNRQRSPEFVLQLRNNVQNAIQRVIFQRTKINPVVLGTVSYVESAAAHQKRRDRQKQAEV